MVAIPESVRAFVAEGHSPISSRSMPTVPLR
jgi:hypothetical protein